MLSVLSLLAFPHSCTNEQYRCQSSQLCILKSNLCDTISQCHDRSDEISCRCPMENDLSPTLFYRCGSTDECLPKNIECDLKRDCESTFTGENDDETSCKATETDSFLLSSLVRTKVFLGRRCPIDRVQRTIRVQRRISIAEALFVNVVSVNWAIDWLKQQATVKILMSVGSASFAISIASIRLAPTDAHVKNSISWNRISTPVSFGASSILPVRHFQLALSASIDLVAFLIGLFHDGIYRLNLTIDNELETNKSSPDRNGLITLMNYTYLMDYDPIGTALYVAQCTVPIRPVTMSCAKTKGIYRVTLLPSQSEKEVRIITDLHRDPSLQLIIDGRDHSSIQSLAVDALHGNLYLVSARSQSIHVCRLNGSFCRVLLHQTVNDFIPQRLIVYPEKG